jgi:hypothetical protein
VSAFSSTSSSWRAISHSCGETIGCIFIAVPPSSGSRRGVRPDARSSGSVVGRPVSTDAVEIGHEQGDAVLAGGDGGDRRLALRMAKPSGRAAVTINVTPLSSTSD